MTQLFTGPPPSPPQSTAGATPEPERNACVIIQPLYNQTSVGDPAVLHGNSVADGAAYGGSPQSSMVRIPSPYSPPSKLL